MIKWRDISIKKKFITLFIIQCISIILVFLILDINTDINFFTFVSFIIFFISLNDSKKTCFIFNIIILLLFLPDNSFNLMQNFNVDYNQLKNYSGENIRNSTSGKSVTSSHFALKKDEKTMYFTCSPVSKDFDDCYKELLQYFGYGDYGDSYYGNNISVKYAEFYHFQMLTIIPFFHKENVIYEIKHNDKIIYGYDYFINKFSQQRKNLLIFVVYVILNSVVFCFFYHWIQKDFLKHSQ